MEQSIENEFGETAAGVKELTMAVQEFKWQPRT